MIGVVCQCLRVSLFCDSRACPVRPTGLKILLLLLQVAVAGHRIHCAALEL